MGENKETETARRLCITNHIIQLSNIYMSKVTLVLLEVGVRT